VSDSKRREPAVALGLSLAAGFIILLGGVVLGSSHEAAGLAPLSLVSGAVVLLGATLLLEVPRKHEVAGLIIIVASGIGLFAYGWLFLSGVGAALGIAAGILAVQWESRPTVAPAAVR
jgi:hypothetical protein